MRPMHTRIAGLLCLLAAVGLTACNQINDSKQIKLKGSGTIVEKTYDLADFDAVDASQTFAVTIVAGDTFSVVVRTDDNVEQYLDVRVQNNTLMLGLDDKNSYNLDGNVTLEAAITLPELVAVRASGASSVTAAAFATERDFAARASGASRISCDALETSGAVTLDTSGSSQITGAYQAAGDMTLKASGDSHITLTGSGAALRIDVSGSSQIDGMLNASGAVTFTASGASKVTLEGSGGDLTLDTSGSSAATLADFVVADVTVKTSGDSTATLHLNGTLTANASGSSRVRYQGEVTLGEIDQSSGASVAALE